MNFLGIKLGIVYIVTPRPSIAFSIGPVHCSVPKYDGTPKFQPSTLLSTNHRTAVIH